MVLTFQHFNITTTVAQNNRTKTNLQSGIKVGMLRVLCWTTFILLLQDDFMMISVGNVTLITQPKKF